MRKLAKDTPNKNIKVGMKDSRVYFWWIYEIPTGKIN